MYVQWRAKKKKHQIQSEVRTMYWLVHAKHHDNDFNVSLFLLAIVLSDSKKTGTVCYLFYAIWGKPPASLPGERKAAPVCL
jgi:hypothetical protein